jgi:hypothetical protein
MASFRDNFKDHRGLLEPTFRVTGGFRKAGTSFLKRVTDKGILTIRSDFIGDMQKLYFKFPSHKDYQELWKPSELIQKILVWIKGSL